MNNYPNSNPQKRRKRRLRKEIRYFLWALLAAVVIFGVYEGTRLIQAQNSITSPDKNPAADSSQTASAPDQTKEKDNEPSYTVLIDPGHGAFDPGNVAGEDESILEKDINLNVAEKVKTELEKINPNAKVILTRNSDDIPWADNELDDLYGRVDLQKSTNADFFVSIHSNAFPGDPEVQGYTLFVNSKDPFMNTMAEDIDKAFVKEGWSSLDDIIADNMLHVVSLAVVPSMLIEMGYMTNPDDLAGLVDEETTDRIAKAIAEGINEAVVQHPEQLAQSKKVYQADHQNTESEDGTHSSDHPSDQASDDSQNETHTDQNQDQHADSQNTENSSDGSGSDQHQEAESAGA